jgi:hypothetical protein
MQAPSGPLPNNLLLASSPSSNASAAVNADNPSPSLPYHLQSWVKTVSDCWKEYDQGISSGYPQPKGPSIKSLDERYGPEWRKLGMTRKAYGRRKCIWETIILIAEQLKVDPARISEKIEKWRTADKFKHVSLSKLNQMLLDVKNGKMGPIWGHDYRVLFDF